jgi:hypothetical protein
MSRKLRLVATLGGLALAATLASPALAGAQGGGLVPSNWDCGSAGLQVFLIPPVTNPHAPFPGFLSPSGAVYVVDAAGPIGGPLTPYGRKVGLKGRGGVWDCISTDFGAEVLLSPAR